MTLCINGIHCLLTSQEEEGEEGKKEKRSRWGGGGIEKKDGEEEKGEEEGGGGKTLNRRPSNQSRLNGGLNSVHTWSENFSSGTSDPLSSFRLLWASLNIVLFIKMCTWPPINQIYRNEAINRPIEENVNEMSWNVANILHLSKECFFSYSLERKNGTGAAELSCPGTGNMTSTLSTCQLEKLNLLEFYRIERGSQRYIPH